VRPSREGQRVTRELQGENDCHFLVLLIGRKGETGVACLADGQARVEVLRKYLELAASRAHHACV